MSLSSDVADLLRTSQYEEWLTVREFARKYSVGEKSVYEAIRKGRLAFEVRKLTVGRTRAIRIGPPKAVAS